jgi:hypothetical protein
MGDLPLTVEKSRGAILMDEPSGTADYRPKLLAAAQRTSRLSQPRYLVLPAGEYHLDGPLDVTSDPELWDNLTICGVPAAGDRQHLYEGDGNARRYQTLLTFHLGAGDVAIDMQRDYRFGQVSLLDFHLRCDNGSLLNFGDPADDLPSDTQTMRGLKLRLDLSTSEPYHGTWMVDRGATHGKTINRTDRFACRLNHCYDVDLDLNIWGFKYGVINNNCDAPRGNIAGLNNGRTLYETSTYGVAAQWGIVKEENPLLGSQIRGGVLSFRGELNPGNYNPAPGPLPMTASHSWQITGGDNKIVFSDWPDAELYDARDYLLPGLVIKLDPSQSGEDDLYLKVMSVTANEATFENAAGNCHVPRPISGTGAALTRYFGLLGVGEGDRFALAQLSSISNIAGVPYFAVLPNRTPLHVPNNSCGRGNDANSAQDTLVIGHCAGTQEGMMGYVTFGGDAGQPNHPNVRSSTRPKPAFSRTIRECHYTYRPEAAEGMRHEYKAEPGWGVSSVNNVARLFTYHARTRQGRTVYTYRPSDNATFHYQIRDTRLTTGVATKVKAWIYSEAGATVNLYGGAGSAVTQAVGAGWTFVELELTSGQVDDDATSTYVRWAGNDYEVCETWIYQ